MAGFRREVQDCLAGVLEDVSKRGRAHGVVTGHLVNAIVNPVVNAIAAPPPAVTMPLQFMGPIMMQPPPMSQHEIADNALTSLHRSIAERSNAQQHFPHTVPQLDQRIYNELGYAAHATLPISRSASQNLTEAQVQFEAASSTKKRDRVLAKFGQTLARLVARHAFHHAAGAGAAAAIPLLAPVAFELSGLGLGVSGWDVMNNNGTSTFYTDQNGNGIPDHQQSIGADGLVTGPTVPMDFNDDVSGALQTVFDSLEQFVSIF